LVNRKLVLAVCFLSLVALASADQTLSQSTLPYFSAQESAFGSVSDPTFLNSEQPYSYLVFIDESNNYCAKNGTDGKVVFNSTDPSYVISSACAQGQGIVLVKRGIYNGTSLDLSYPNVRLIGEGQATILQFTEGITVHNTTESYHQEISNLQLIGTGYANYGLTLNGASRFVSYNLIVQNYDTGIYIKSSPIGATIFNNFYSLMSHDNNVGILVTRAPGDNTVAHNTFYGGSIVTNLQWGVLIEGSASNEIFDGVEIENNRYGQVLLKTTAAGLVPEGNTFCKCYFEPWLLNDTAPFIEFRTELLPDTLPWGNIFKENKFAVVGDVTLTLPNYSIFDNNYISGQPVTFTIIAIATGCEVDGNVNPAGVVQVNYVGTGNTGRIMQISKTSLVQSSRWINFGATFPKGPIIQISVTGNGEVINAWAYQIEASRFYLVMFYSNEKEVTTPQYVTWTATLNLP
jgi:hypothetical protein